MARQRLRTRPFEIRKLAVRTSEPLRRHRPACTTKAGRRAPARLGQHRAHARATSARSASGSCSTPRTTSPRSARSPATRRCSRCAPASRPSTSRGWQVAADANTAGQMYPDQSLYPVDSVPNVVKRINALAAARRPDRARRRQARARLVRADHGRRRGRLRRPAQRLRADEGDDRGRRRGRALRGPARLARRSAATWAARCSCRPASSSARSSPRASPPT